MLLESLTIDREAFESGTGWALKTEGACRGEICVPLNESGGAKVDVADLAQQIGLPLVHDAEHELWALGPWAGSARALTTAEAPELVLPDIDGRDFSLSSLRGHKVLLIAWAPY